MCAVIPSATPFLLPLFSYTYKLPNLQPLCFDNDTTVGGGGYASVTTLDKHLNSPVKKDLKTHSVWQEDACNRRCKIAPLFSTSCRMLLPQPLSFHAFALLPGGVYGGDRIFEFRTSSFEHGGQGAALRRGRHIRSLKPYFSALAAGSLAEDSFAAASLAAALACESRYQSKVICKPRSKLTWGS